MILFDFLANPHNAWLITAFVQVGCFIAAVVTGYWAGAADQKRVQQRQDQLEYSRILTNPSMDADSDHAVHPGRRGNRR